MAVRSLQLSNFRNYHFSELNVSTTPVVLTGANGAGKTNILEAISFLIPGRGLRKARLAEIDRKTLTRARWAVSAEVGMGEHITHIGTGRQELSGDELHGDKRIVKIDGKRIRGQADLTRHFAVVWLVPQLDQLFMEGASARRKFLDRMVFCFEPEHASRVNAYDHSMRERNRLLQDGIADDAWLTVLEQKMAEKSVEIAFSRMKTVERLNHSIMMSPRSFPKARAELFGRTEEMLRQGTDIATATAEMLRAYSASRQQDRASGRAAHGAHKASLSVHHLQKDMAAESCSTGEQKAMLLSLVMAQVRASVISGERVPVLLLDEVIAHLDESRRSELFNEIVELGAQVWMTGTDDEAFAGLRGKATFLRVEHGIINGA